MRTVDALRATCAAVLTGVLAAGCAAAAAAARPAGTWLIAADLHIDPFDRSNRPPGAGRDGNVALVESAISAMRGADPRPDLILVAGDSLAHHFGALARRNGVDANDAGIQTMRRIAGAFGRAFPATQFALVLGNNDAPCGDYRSDFGGRFLRETASAWAPLVDRRSRGAPGGSAPTFEAAFPQRGSYTVDLPRRGLRIAVLDTVPMAAAYRGTCSGAGRGSADQQLQWLRHALASAPRGTRTVVAMHLPAGYDAVATTLARGLLAVSYLNPPAARALTAAQALPQDRVAFSIAAHAHHFDVRIFGKAVTLIAGAISPIYGNRPTFYRLTVGNGGEPLDLTAYAYDERDGRWHPHEFDRQWKVRSLDATSLRALHERLKGDPAMRRAWGVASAGWTTDAAPLEPWRGSLWRVAWCAQTMAADGFERCSGIAGRTRAALALAIAIAALALLGLGVTVAAIVRKVPFRSRRNLVKL